MCKLINLFEQDDAVDKRCNEASAHTVSVGLKNTHQRGGKTEGKKDNRRHKRDFFLKLKKRDEYTLARF